MKFKGFFVESLYVIKFDDHKSQPLKTQLQVEFLISSKQSEKQEKTRQTQAEIRAISWNADRLAIWSTNENSRRKVMKISLKL